MTCIADLFSKMRTPESANKQFSRKSPFRGHFEKQHIKGDQLLLKSESHHLYHISRSLFRQLSEKKYLLVIFKPLGMFLNLLTAEEMYSLLNRDNLRQPIQMQLSQKQKKYVLNLCLHF